MEEKKMDKEDKKEEMKKEDINTSDALNILLTTVKTQSDQIASITKSLEELSKKNVVDEGKTEELKPSLSGNEVGAKTKLSNEYQGKSEQSGINHTEESPSVPTKVHLNKADDEDKMEEKKMEKEDDDKKDEKKMEKAIETEVKKQDPTDDTNHNQIVKMSNGYEYTKTQTPRPAIADIKSAEGVTGWDIYKAVENGWGGRFNNYEQSLQEMSASFNRGELGSGRSAEGAN